MTGTEIKVLNMIQDHLRSAAADVVMPAITKLGNAGIIWIVMGVTLLATKKYRRAGILVLMALVVDLVCCNLILKNLIARPRPFDVNPMVKLLVAAPGDFSFPSGHTAASFAAVTALFLEKAKFWWAALILALLITFSRLYLYLHYPTDILGGILTGVISGIIAMVVFRRLEKIYGKNHIDTVS